MIYILDTNIIRKILSHLPKKGAYFDAIWNALEDGISTGLYISVDECYNELTKQYSKDSDALRWIKKHRKMFLPITNQESIIVRDIFLNNKFRENVHQKNILDNRPSADAFLVAKGRVLEATIVTSEKYKPNSSQLPNMCQSYEIPCIGYDDFMEIITQPLSSKLLSASS